jgi:outer membrane receptor protein involved in Fe transport
MLERFPSYHAGEPFNESNVPLIQAGTIKHINYGPVPDNFNEPFTRTRSEIPNSQEHGSNLNVVGRYFFTDNQSVKLNLIRRRTADIGFPDFEPPFFFQVINLPASRLDKASLRYEATGLGTWFSRLAVGGYWQHQDRRLFNDFFVLGLSVPPPGEPPFANLSRVDIVSNTGQNVKSFGYDLQANFLLGTKNIVTAGTSLFRDHSRDSRRTVVDVTLIGVLSYPAQDRFFPRNFPIVRGAVDQTPRVPISNFQDAAVFVQDEHELSRAWRLVASFRFDRFDIDSRPTPDYDPRPPELQDADPPIDPTTVPPIEGIRFNRTSVTGDFGVVYRPISPLSITARIGRSFRHPNLSELFFAGPAESGTLVPNISVKPEKGINLDIGAKLRTDRFSGSVTYFHNWYRDFLSREEISFSPEAGGLIYQALNFSRVRIQGVEADWELPFQAPYSIFSFFGNFSYLWGEVIEGENPLTHTQLENAPASNITPFKVVAGLRWNDRPNRFWWEYSTRSQTHVNRISPLLFQSPLLQPEDLWNVYGFTIHSLRGGFNLFRGERSQIGVTLALENLGNKFYREHFQYAPARGRSFTVGLNLKYF